MKRRGHGKEYDCIIGVSGGVDSSFLAIKVKELGLRPLAVHVDNGWNSEKAVGNIKRILDPLHIDLSTLVLNWKEFRELQLAFLRASTPDSEIPSDHAIVAALLRRLQEASSRLLCERRQFENRRRSTFASGRKDIWIAGISAASTSSSPANDSNTSR